MQKMTDFVALRNGRHVERFILRERCYVCTETVDRLVDSGRGITDVGN